MITFIFAREVMNSGMAFWTPFLVIFGAALVIFTRATLCMAMLCAENFNALENTLGFGLRSSHQRSETVSAEFSSLKVLS